MARPNILIYRTQSEGIGKLLNCLALARSLSRQYHPVVLNNGALPPGIDAPDGVDVVQLPAWEHAPGTGVVGIWDAQEHRRAVAERRDFLLQMYADLNPEILLIDTFPFGDHNAGDELLPLLEKTRSSSGPSPRVVCCVLDVQNGPDSNLQNRDDETARLLERFYDMVLAHTDPSFSRLEEYFQPKNTLSTPVYHTGFLLPGQNSFVVGGARENSLLVSAGGGATGGPLFRAAIDSHRLLWDAEQLPMTIVTGPMLSRKEWSELRRLGTGMQGLTIKRSVPNLGSEMSKVRYSVSQCGYSAATEAVASGVSALFVPSGGRRNAEQTDRAHRLAHWGVGRLLIQEHLNAVSLANEIIQLVRFTPRETSFSTAGLATTTALLEREYVGYTDHEQPLAAGLGLTGW